MSQDPNYSPLMNEVNRKCADILLAPLKPATPKHRLRATVTYTLEYDADAEYYPGGIRALAASVKRDIVDGNECPSDMGVDPVVKVEVIR